jgi:RecB family exonuclease
MRGIVDRLDKTDNEWIINDYKTNQKLPTQDQEKYTEQLSLYALGVFQKYGKFFQKLKARLHYLHFDLVDEWEMTLESLQPLIQKYKTLIEKVDHEKFAYAMGDSSAFSPQENTGCTYCDYKSICPLRAHL